MSPLAPFLACLGFLTRLGPSRRVEPEVLGRCLPHLPLVGLALGALLVLPMGLGLGHGHPLAQAWLLTLASAWLTRGLHLDGLADIADALSSHTTGDAFWTILKDSRTGAFGAAALCLALAGQIILAADLLAASAFAPLAWTFMAGRMAAALLGRLGRSLARPGLGQLFLAGSTLTPILAAAVLTLGLGLTLIPAKAALAASLLALAPVPALLRLGRKVGGLNGDFLGAAVVLGELGALLGLVLA